MRPLIIFRDPSSVPTYGIKLTDGGFTAQVEALVDIACPVPVGARIAVFGFAQGANVWVADSEITLPALGVFGANNAMLNPPPLVVSDEDYVVPALHFLAESVCNVSVAFYR